MVAGMGLAAVYDLDLAHFIGNPFEPLHITEEEIRPLVGGGTPGKADCQDVLIHACPGFVVDQAHELLLALHVRVPELVSGNAQGVAQTEIVLSPQRNMAVEQFSKRRGNPGGGMDPVGDGLNVIACKHEP
ncbi:MAG: hypothetical protein A4E70_02344 [Syntrophus sp. PtaU1.Bin005]|nr:MAG: hypothetical protein A4E70_02344 [Syntrophus sp. PtaU1.Bin005]